MHGLIDRSIEGFLRGTYGQDFWSDICRELELGFESFEPMFRYSPEITHRLVDQASFMLGKPRDALLEDLGTYLITDARSERVRRLLRFGGATYTEFLHSLEDLPGRARLAVPDLDMPEIELDELSEGMFTLTVRHPELGFGHVILGALRALADDYGALALLDYTKRTGNEDSISVQLLDMDHAVGRSFELSAEAS